MKTATLMFLIASTIHAAGPIVLWPKGAPGEMGDIGEEKDTTGPNGQLIAGKRVIRLGNVSNPTITVYSPPQEKTLARRCWCFPAAATAFLRSIWRAPKCAIG